MQLAPRQLDLFGNLDGVPRSGSLAPQAVPPEVPPLEVAPPPLAIHRLAVSSRQQTLARARALATKIAGILGAELKVLLAVHDNRSTMISFRRQAHVLMIRAHHMFLDAPQSVVESIAAYAGRGDLSAGADLDRYIARQQEQIRALPRSPSLLEARGKCFDLQELFERLNQTYFEGAIQARIGWGRNTGKRRRKSIRLGVYDHKAREIRVHPALDKPDVPRFFVEFIVFHEMLHQLFPRDRDSGRHAHHPRGFRERERSFPKFEASLAWERQHLQELLRR